MGKNGTKIIILFLIFTIGCKAAQPRAVRQAERKYDKELKEEQKAYEGSRKAYFKHHYAIQSPATRERMKETEKRSKKYGRSQKEPICKRIFKSKKPKRKKVKRKRRR